MATTDGTPMRPMLSRTCWLGLHKWTAWRDVRHGELTRKGRTTGYYVDQERRCRACGVVRSRTETL